MSENTDHETGGTLVNEDIITEGCGNTKFVIIQSADPSPTHDGQMFVDTDDATPIIRTQDKTNTQWMTNRSTKYTTGTTWIEEPDSYSVTSGHSVLKYNSGDTFTRLYFFANSKYWMSGTG